MRILRYPDPILKQVSIDCTIEDLPDIRAASKEMIEIMLSIQAEGIAAVQVGIAKRFCVLNLNSKVVSAENPPIALINPVIVEKDEESLEAKWEGCLSLPKFYETIKRYNEIVVEYLDLDFQPRKAVFDGINSQCLQHEIDHFNGVLQTDTVSPMKRQMWIKKARKNGYIK